jgi:predicted lipid-binding transport protein (Tim44 family)
MLRVVALLLFGSAAVPALAQEQIIYPAKGQSAQQQDKDKYECYGWAKGQTGFDPMALPVTTTPAPQGGNKSVAGGAVGGAAAGAAIGAVGGVIGGGKKGAGKGAGMGAGMGGLLGGMSTAGQNQKASQDRQNWEQREAANYANRRNTYNRAFAACLEGRGYTVR